MNKRLWFVTTLLFVFSSVFPSWSSAQTTDSKKGYQFNSSGGTSKEFDRELKFKLPTDAPADSKVDYIKDAESSIYFKKPLGYPKKELLLSYNPGFNAFKNVLTTDNDYTFTFNNNTVANLSAGFRYNTSIEDFFGIDFNMMRVTVPNFRDTSKGYSIDEQTIYLTGFLFSGYFCRLGDTTFNKFCPGFEVGLDSYPVFDFGGPSKIELKEIRDLVIGPSLIYSKPLTGETVLLAKASYNYGLATGQSDRLGVKFNQKLTGQIGVEFPWKSLYWNILGGLDYRNAKVKNNQDEWTMTNTAYTAKLGLRWEWGSPL